MIRNMGPEKKFSGPLGRNSDKFFLSLHPTLFLKIFEQLVAEKKTSNVKHLPSITEASFLTLFVSVAKGNIFYFV